MVVVVVVGLEVVFALHQVFKILAVSAIPIQNVFVRDPPFLHIAIIPAVDGKASLLKLLEGV